MEFLSTLSSIAEENVEAVYDTLETLCICFPGRVSGSDSLERALDFLYDYGRSVIPEELCYQEKVCCVPQWIRGNWKDEWCRIEIIPCQGIKPIPFPTTRQFRVLANGLSIGTGPDGVSGDLVIVNDWDQLKLMGERNELQDKIILYDYKYFESYGSHSRFRGQVILL